MSKEQIFKELITEMAKDGEISSSEYAILIEKGKDLGLTSSTIDILIKMELSDFSKEDFSLTEKSQTSQHQASQEVYNFSSAITRGGSILTPDRIVIDSKTLTYKRRNKHLINVDSTTVPISKISSVTLDTSILGTDIIIKTFGAGEIIAKKFTKADAREIERLIRERQNSLF